MKLNWRIPIVCKAILDNFKIDSIIDLGCARGDYIQGFLEAGIDAWGIEGSPAAIRELLVPEHKVMIGDLRKPFNIANFRRKYDLAMCFEVVEHVEEEYSDIMCENFTKVSDKVLVTAARPGQGGHYHMNCQPKEYWEEKMAKFGYRSDREKAEKIKKSFTKKERKEIAVYCNNLIYFKKMKAKIK